MLVLTMATNKVYSQNPEAIRKRKYQLVLKEKKRRSFFVHDYIRTKYPKLYTEANAMYQDLAERYPGRADFTKTYFYKKWEKEIDDSRTNPPLLQPHLPILSTPEALNQAMNQEPIEVLSEEPVQVLSEEPVQVLSEEPVEVLNEEPVEVLREEVIEAGVQQPEESFPTLSLEEVDQIIKDLQADPDTRNIMDEFDLPDDVWEKELSIPDDLLEMELQW